TCAHLRSTASVPVAAATDSTAANAADFNVLPSIYCPPLGALATSSSSLCVSDIQEISIILVEGSSQVGTKPGQGLATCRAGCYPEQAGAMGTVGFACTRTRRAHPRVQER